MDMLTGRVGSILAGGLMALISIVFYQPMVNANETLLATMSNHCSYNGIGFVAVQNWNPDSDTPTAVANTGSTLWGADVTQLGTNNCEVNVSGIVAGTDGDALTLYTVQGDAVAFAHTGTAGEADLTANAASNTGWQPRPAALNLFGNIVGTVVNLIPIFLILTMVMGPVSTILNGNANWTEGLYTRLGMLIAVFVTIYILPPIMEQLESAQGVTANTSAYRSTNDFGSILDIIFSAVYLVLLLVVVGLIGYQGFNDVKGISSSVGQMRGAGAPSGMGM